MPRNDEGGGASRTTEPAGGTSAATDVSLREHLAQRLHDAEYRIDERDRYIREADWRWAQERDLRYAEQREADHRLANARREADQLAIALQRKVDEEHFAHLNEAAARSIEERSHFATRELTDAIKESFGVFKEEINTRLDIRSGERQGVTGSARVLVGALGAIATLLAIFAFYTSTQDKTPVVVQPTVTVPAK